MWRTKGMTSSSLGIGIVLIIIGIVFIIIRPHDMIIKIALDQQLPLDNDTFGFDTWKSVDLEFKVYIFHVVNPNEVQNNGDTAILVEYGPYVYDDHIEKTIIGVNETADTIDYITRRTLVFNATKSGKFSENDEITILNFAYLGTILTIADKFSPFLTSLGNFIPLLFPDKESIFVRGKVKDILFDGLPLTCDTDIYPQLALLCGVLKNKMPPIVRVTPEEGVYAYSFFNKLNGTDDGPFTLSRGMKDRYTAGYISQFKGSPYADYWSEKNCAIVKGTDSIFYPSLSYREPKIFTFASDLCRSIYIEYTKDIMYNGLIGYHYQTTKNLWNDSDSSCYCPRAANGTIMCPLPGLLNFEKCQEGPVVMSEPHFLHGANGLFSLTQGLNPDEEKHAAYVVVEPLTGAPLSGSRKMQLNMMLQPLVVDLLANVSQGVFPLLWVDEGLTPGLKLLAPAVLAHRLNRLLGFLTSIPLILGVIFVMYSYCMNAVTKTEYRTSGRIKILAPKTTPN